MASALRDQKVGQLFAIGHSYGGLTILKSNADLDGAVLWDPSHGTWWSEDRDDSVYPETNVGKYVIGTAGKGWAYSREAKEYDEQLGDTSSLAAKDYPLKIISAGKGVLADLGKRYYESANQPKHQIVIDQATHGFDDSDEVMLELFEQTYDWLAGVLPQR